jgi:hypothetical protein
MTEMHPGVGKKSESSTIAKEFIFGLLAIALGGFNLLTQFKVIDVNFEMPQIFANIVLVIVGLILWMTAYKLWMFRWHSRRLF